METSDHLCGCVTLSQYPLTFRLVGPRPSLDALEKREILYLNHDSSVIQPTAQSLYWLHCTGALFDLVYDDSYNKYRIYIYIYTRREWMMVHISRLSSLNILVLLCKKAVIVINVSRIFCKVVHITWTTLFNDQL